MGKLDRCDGSSKSLKDPSNSISVPNKTEDENKNDFDMIIRTNEPTTLTKHICNCKCKFDSR